MIENEFGPVPKAALTIPKDLLQNQASIEIQKGRLFLRRQIRGRRMVDSNEL